MEYLTSRYADALAQLPKNYHAYSGVLYDPATYDSATTDTDSDGFMDAVDLDDDNDGILDSLEKGTCDASANPTYPGDYSAFADLVANNPLHYTATYNHTGFVLGTSDNSTFEPVAGQLNHHLDMHN